MMLNYLHLNMLLEKVYIITCINFSMLKNMLIFFGLDQMFQLVRENIDLEIFRVTIF